MSKFVDAANAQIILTANVAPGNSAAIIYYTNAGVEVSPWSKATYSANLESGFTPAATATDVVIIKGSPTKRVKLVSCHFSTANTAGGGSISIFLIKRNTPAQGGTSVAAVMVPFDSGDPAATANVAHYTANPTTVGNAVGTVSIHRISVPAISGSMAGLAEEQGIELLTWYAQSMLDELLTLNGQDESLCINLNGATLLTGQTHRYRIIWVEE